jgi:hypothetical protein
MKAKANYQVVAHNSSTVWIVDLNGARMSVTNDAEAVVDEVLRMFPNHLIVYRDSIGNWDELEHDGTRFLGFGQWIGPLPPL